jgi:hypothetical protein
MTSTLDHIDQAAPRQPATTDADETQVEALARYAARASFEDLSSESRRLLPVHTLDCLACPTRPWGAGPINVCRDQVRDFGGGNGTTLIGGGSANPVYAAFWQTMQSRLVDHGILRLGASTTPRSWPSHTTPPLGGFLGRPSRRSQMPSQWPLAATPRSPSFAPIRCPSGRVSLKRSPCLAR